VTDYYTDDSVRVIHGDCLDVLRAMPDASVDAVVTDPPYGLEFMGREWDGPKGFLVASEADTNGYATGLRLPRGSMPDAYRAGVTFQAWCETWATECLRVLKPGGHLLAFGGTRTWHRLACAIEDAGFEIRDSIANLTGGDATGSSLVWLYGSGFP
jgi:site-specific DNA-methyltransferase (adenine-specific)